MSYSRRSIIRNALLGTALTCASMAIPAAARAARKGKRPNIIVILADDMGYSDIGCFGSEIPTPNIDRLAAGGLSFTQFYNCARCSCSRASLLTGLYPHQAGLGYLEEVRWPESEGVLGQLADRAVTLAEVLGQAGYATSIAGKWHVGNTRGLGPRERGFDRSITPLIGGLYFPDQLTPNQQTMYIDGVKLPVSSPQVGEGHWYATDLFVDWGLRFIDEARGADRPFFFYLPFTAPHFSLMAPPEDIARFKGKYRAGWDAIRRDRFERQKASGIVDADAILPPLPAEADDWDALDDAARDRFDTMMAIYAATIYRMDRAIGRLVDELRARGELDDTLIIFASDNGGNAEGGPEGKAKSLGGPLGSAQSSVFTGLNWATLQNTPLRYFKHYTEEGGIATPLIAHWPAGIDAGLRGAFVRSPNHFVDIMPTLAEVAGASYPARFRGHAILPMEGRSLVPAFSGRLSGTRRPIFWEHEGNRAVRDGRWKALSRGGRPWELYDIEADRTELNDLAGRHPATVEALSRQWEEWAARSCVGHWRAEMKLAGRGVGNGGRPVAGP